MMCRVLSELGYKTMRLLLVPRLSWARRPGARGFAAAMALTTACLVSSSSATAAPAGPTLFHSPLVTPEQARIHAGHIYAEVYTMS